MVTMGRKPLRATLGDLISHTVMPASSSAMQMKNTATGVVQTIQLNMICLSVGVYTRPIAKPFAM